MSEGSLAHIAQLAEHFLGKEEVIGSSPIVGSTTAAQPQDVPNIGHGPDVPQVMDRPGEDARAAPRQME